MYWETNHETFYNKLGMILKIVNSIINNKEKIIEEYTDLIEGTYHIYDKEEICKQLLNTKYA